MDRPAARVFAAVDANNRIRFIDDVPSGAMCGCFCATCGSALVARKGDVNIHHFAHESRQERPECLAGAMNLLRRLAGEYLRKQGVSALPKYRSEVSRQLLSGRAVERVEWDAQPRSIRWLQPVNQDDPIARLSLNNGIEADLMVIVSNTVPTLQRPSSRIALIAYWSTVPVDSDLRKEIYALQHLSRNGQLVWIFQPDVFGLVAAAEKRLRDRAVLEEKLANERVARTNTAFERRFLATQMPARSAPPAPGPRPANVGGPEIKAPSAADLPSWAQPRKRHASFFGHRFADKRAWVYFELEQGGFGLRDLRAPEGWHESIPAHVGTYDAALDLVRCATPPHFAGAPVATQISTDFADVLKLLC